jgi:predicted nucleic acid-binding protein
VRVLVDTSVWADFLNGVASPEANSLAALLDGDHEVCTCGIVVAEVFQGLRQEKGRSDIQASFEELVFLEPSGIAMYFRAAEVYRALRSRGRTVRSTVDCVIAVLAAENDCFVLARDRDMDALLASGLVAAQAWPH